MTVAARATLEHLLAIRPGADWITSCYIRLLPRDRARTRYLTQLKSRRQALERTLDLFLTDRAERRAVAGDLERIMEFTAQPNNLPHAGGLAMFASSPAGLFETVALPRVYRPRLVVDRDPAVRELIASRADFGHVLAVVLDRSHARVFSADAFAAHEIEGIPSGASRGGKFHGDRQNAPGSGEHGYHRRREAEIARHFNAVIEQLVTLDRTRRAQGFVLAGPPRRVTAFRDALPRDLAGRVLGRASLGPKSATAATVHAAVLDARAEHEASVAHDTVAEMLAGVGEGWAVRGIEPTLTALAAGRLRSLLVSATAVASGFRCAESGRLVLDPTACRGPGAPIPVTDVIDEAVEEALRLEVAVTLVQAPGDTEAVQALAGILRYT